MEQQQPDNIEMLNKIRAYYRRPTMTLGRLAAEMHIDTGALCRALKGEASERVHLAIGEWLAEHMEDYPC